MYIHTDKYGRTRKFANAKAARQYFKRMEETYIPEVVPDEIYHTDGVGNTRYISKKAKIRFSRFSVMS